MIDTSYLNNIVTIEQLHAQGYTAALIERSVRKGKLVNLAKSIYATREPLPGFETFVADLGTLLLRCGPNALASHRSAALLHGFDDATKEFIEVTAEATRGCRIPGVTRSSTIRAGDRVVLGGIPCTAVPRTLLDLAQVLNLDQLEMAVESALRGPDSFRPDAWNADLLGELLAQIDLGARKGISSLRAVLARRPTNTRPTGSAIETLLVQAVRNSGGNDLDRQLTVRIIGPRGNVIRTLYPDFGELDCGLVVEADGEDAHTGPKSLERDLARQNELMGVFTILRFTGSLITANPAKVARDIAHARKTLPRQRLQSRRDIRFTPFGIDILR